MGPDVLWLRESGIPCRVVHQKCWGIPYFSWISQNFAKWNGHLRYKGCFCGPRPGQARLLSPVPPAAGWYHCFPIKLGPLPAAAALGAAGRLKELSCVTSPSSRAGLAHPTSWLCPYRGTKKMRYGLGRNLTFTVSPKNFKVVIIGNICLYLFYSLVGI